MENRAFRLQLVRWCELPGDLAEKEYFLSAYPAPLDAKFHALSVLYLESSPRQRQRLTDFFAHSSTPIWARHAHFDNAIIYMRRVARCIQSTADDTLLNNGLAVAAWTHGHVEDHDLLISLAFLHYAATRAGIDPAPYFKTIAVTAESPSKEALRSFLHCSPATVRRMVQHYEGTG